MSTLVVYSPPGDGYIESADFTNSYSNARTGGGTKTADVNLTIAVIGQVFDNSEGLDYYVYEGYLSFDTSSIGTGTVSSATLNLTSGLDNSTTDFTIEGRLYDWGGTLTTADYLPGNLCANYTLLASRNTSAGWTAGTSYDLTSEAAFATNINKTGTTYLCLHSSRTRTNNAPTLSLEYVHFRSADYAGTTNDPKLTIEYTAAATNPVWVSPADGVVMSSTPTLTFTMPTNASPMFFNMQLDTANTFNTGNLRDLDSSVSQTGWEYWTGATWSGVTAGGVPAAYSGNDARHTVQTALPSPGTTWYRRVRART